MAEMSDDVKKQAALAARGAKDAIGTTDVTQGVDVDGGEGTKEGFKIGDPARQLVDKKTTVDPQDPGKER